MSRLKPGEGGYLVLLISLFAMLVVRPLLHELGEVIWLLPIFVTLVLLACVWAVARRRNQVMVLTIIILVVIVDHWTSVAGVPWMHESVGPLLSVVFYGWIAVILALDVFSRQDKVTADLIFGGINIYLLMGLGFASAHHALAILAPSAYNGLNGKEMEDAVYFSFVTLTTLGYGDITPHTEGARMLAYVEALFGQLYVAVLLARLVAMQLTSSNRP
jgi:voltage-gated potassium channel